MKSLDEVKNVVEKFPQASGAGYVVGPALLKVATQKTENELYGKALERWAKSSVDKEEVGETKELSQKGHNLLFVWDGPPIEEKDGVITVGIKGTIDYVSGL